jgi:hypothetical protein
MKHLILGAAVLFLTAVCPARADTGTGLQSAGSFALGGIGVAGTISAGERALREVLKQPDAVTELEALLPNASPAGKLYALLGLRVRDRAACGRALEKYRALDAKVETARGCILQHESFRDLVKEIESGQYDSFLAREWLKDAR